MLQFDLRVTFAIERCENKQQQFQFLVTRMRFVVVIPLWSFH